MAKEKMLRHCTCEKKTEDGKMVRVFWGDSEKAVAGREVTIEEHDGTWTSGWTVVSTHGDPLPEKYVRHQSHAWTRQRAASDI